MRIRESLPTLPTSTTPPLEHHHEAPLVTREWAHACGTSVDQLTRCIDQGRQARSTLIAANTGLVVSIAKRQHQKLQESSQTHTDSVGCIVTLPDLIQEGTVGLVKAAERFCPERQCRFSTYATYWIRAGIFRALQTQSRVIRLPAHILALLTKMKRAQHQWKHEHEDQNIPLPALAQALQMDVRKLHKVVEYTRSVMSLERPVGYKRSSSSDASSSWTLLETLVSDAPTPEEDAVQQALQQDVHHLLESASLKQEERAVLNARYGLSGSAAQSTSATATGLHMSRDRVRLLERRALTKLRNNHEQKQQLQDYVFSTNSQTRSHDEASPSTEKQQPAPDRFWFY